ncbi:MAG: 4-hydroxyphenylacetate 3-hydroxylase N-terminal domain-containing protein [Bacillota bacterium]|nr:4-hydroxyphenylacetate 3-hydroxylase N-terminal domain-containing protein [Bacillota bacterium]
MALRSGAEYRERLRTYSTNVYLLGERIHNVLEHPCLAPVVNSVATTFDPDAVGVSPELAFRVTDAGETINRHNHVFRSADDAVARVHLVRELTRGTGACTHRCVGIDAINALDIVTREVDEARGTEYHERFRAFLRKAAAEDLALTASVTDPKGDRGLRPGQQPDPDLYLHIIDRNERGIVVRGAKAHQGRPMAVDYTLVLPTMGMQAGEEEYAVAFAVANGSPGVTQIVGTGPAEAWRLVGQEEDFGNAAYGTHPGTLVVFEDVLIPWENVFLAGEVEHTARLVELFASYHRMATGGCKAGLCDVIVGAAAQIAEYNGVAKASHIRDKIVEMIRLSETAFSGSIASAVLGRTTPSGNYLPDTLLANVAKLNAAQAVTQSMTLLAEVAGALAATAPAWRDLEAAPQGELLRKYLVGSAQVPCEARLKMFRLVQNLLFGVQGLVALNGGGPPQTQRMAVYAQARLEEKKALARRISGQE